MKIGIVSLGCLNYKIRDVLVGTNKNAPASYET